MATAAVLRELRKKHGLGEFKKTASRINPKTGLTKKKSSAKSRARAPKKIGTRATRRSKKIRPRALGVSMTKRSPLSEYELARDARSNVVQFTGTGARGGSRRQMTIRKPGPMRRSTRKRF